MMQNNRLPFAVIGITGGVGSGKSTVLSYLQETWGAQINECDRIGRELQEKDGACYEPMCRLLQGRDCFGPDGFDRKKLAALLFGDPDLLEEVNRIVHPAVFAAVEERIRDAKKRDVAAVVESALLVQGGYESVCDEIWYIYADEAVRRERLKASRGYTDEHIDRILSSQAADSFFREHCDRVIDNSSPVLENTYRQIEEALRALYGRYCQTEEARRALYGTYCQTEKKLRALSDREEDIPMQTHRRPEDASL